MTEFVHASGLRQSLCVADLTTAEGLQVFESLGPADAVYGDPPWSAGNEKWWRRFGGFSHPGDYSRLLDAIIKCIIATGARSALIEQSINAKHKGMFFDAIARCSMWTLPLAGEYLVRYGSPLRPNALLHFGHAPLTADPSGLSGELMTQVAISGLGLKPGSVIADPCMGLGMTSRQAHKHGCHCYGTELNPVRLSKTISWLLRNGYR